MKTQLAEEYAQTFHKLRQGLRMRKAHLDSQSAYNLIHICEGVQKTPPTPLSYILDERENGEGSGGYEILFATTYRREIERFLGFANFYQRFRRGFSFLLQETVNSLKWNETATQCYLL